MTRESAAHGGHEVAARSNASSLAGSLCCAGLGADQVEPGRQCDAAEECPQLPSQTIADDGWSDGATECVGHPRWRCSRIGNVRAPQHSGPGSPASRARRVNALRSRMRQIKPTGCAGPWRGVLSARLARRGCSSGDGSRASWRGDDCSVGRCASRNPPRRRTCDAQHFRWQVRIWKGTPQLLG